ncbi:hypothetical protein QMZ05_12170 [Bradyrhizobium sp. INPA03-11B]|uniref:hypothetical protein n=1 Tax=Bradyrhizobium sp. INPA03-11B TaxID=418598 RepID=UPI00338EDF6C
MAASDKRYRRWVESRQVKVHAVRQCAAADFDYYVEPPQEPDELPMSGYLD